MSADIARHLTKPPGESDACHVAEKHLARRTFLKAGLYGLFSSAFWGQLARFEALADAPDAVRLAKHCIVLFMNGGPAQTDTFDPKPDSKNAGPLRAIRTSAPDILLSQHLPQLAEQAHHLTLIRSMVTGEGNHSRARYLMHTGYAPTGSVKHPTFGSILAAETGDANFDLPNAVAVNSPIFDAAFLGAENDPFLIADPTRGVENLAYAADMYPGRFRARMDMVGFLNDEFARRTSDAARERAAVYEKADRLIHSPLAKAFDLAQEPDSVRAAYGMSNFGQGCILARRLIEAGVRFVEVSLDGWDTHQNNFEAVQGLLSRVDPAMASLIRELDEHDLLQDTLVLWMGEFGRTPRINENDGRDHWPNGWTAAMAGGRLPGGRVIGATDDDGERVVERPVPVQDFFYSLCRAFGVDPTKVNYSRIGRPIKVVDGGGPIEGLLPAAG
jgi:uncharacterized protein (DUF1501 family)